MRQNQKTVSPTSNEGRNTYVIKQITDTLLKLLQVKPIDEISISELCEKALVGRASFYRNFNSKEDILRLYIHSLIQRWATSSTQEDKSLSTLLRSLFFHFESHLDFYKILNKRNLLYLLKDVLIDIFGPKPEHSKEEAYARAYYVYALYGWIEVWFKRGMKETSEEIENMFKKQGL